MMKQINKAVLGAAFGLSLLLLGVGCKKDDAKYSVLRNQAYIEQTDTKANIAKSVVVADEGVSYAELSVRLSDVQSEDSQFELVVDPTILERYNEVNGTNYLLYPEAQHKIANKQLTITAGGTRSLPINVEIQPLTQEQRKSGEKYAIPFSLKSKDGKVAILSGGSDLLYTLNPVIVTSVPVLGTDNLAGFGNTSYMGLTATSEAEIEMPAWTVEFRVNMNGFNRNNQALFGSWGTNSEIYIRFGDAGTPFNTLQVKFGGTQFDKSNTIFSPNTWYHIAVVYDGSLLTLYVNGQKDLDTDKVAGKVFNLGKVLHVANSGQAWFVNRAMMSEMRVWKVARTQKQLIENEYGISPKTPGLLHYWKMNEGEGNILNNSVAGAPALKPSSDRPLRWIHNVRSDGKGAKNSDK